MKSKKQNIIHNSGDTLVLDKKMQNAISQFLAIIFELGKVKITFFVAFSSLFGFLLFTKSLSFLMLFNSLGVFLLACGASALNHVQEWKYDKLMSRTKFRPIPSGKISVNYGITVVVLSILFGSGLIYFTGNFTAVLIGLATVVWYNAIYTPMKRKSAFAVIPGALIGALPPIIGWVSGGGNIFDHRILIVASFLFVWQVPHFWLLFLIYGKDYEKGGFPSIERVFTSKQVRIMTFALIFNLVIISIIIPLFAVSSKLLGITVIGIIGAWLIANSFKILKSGSTAVLRKTFMNINIYVLVVVTLISLDNIFLTAV